jgi:carboxyl-terminal processing protease
MKICSYYIILIISVFLSLNICKANEISEYKAARIYTNFLELINKNSKQNISNKEVLKHSISSVLKEFKDDSYFIDENGYRELSKIGRGHFYGIGISLESKKGIYSIKSVVKGSPAYEHGLNAGDIVLEMAGIKLTEESIGKALLESNSSNRKDVEVLVKKVNTNKLQNYKILKKEIKINNIETKLNGNILYIKIKAFNNEVVKDIESLIKGQNDQVKSYIIDLRDNFGGLLPQAVGLIDLILDDGIIVGIDYRAPKPREVFYAKKGNIFASKKIIILVNKRSASASEIVASALQDHKRALIMGSKTYGKTTVQQLYKLDEIGAAAITIAKYHRPNGNSLEGGVTPDVIVNTKDDIKGEDKLLGLAIAKLGN